MDFMDLCLGGLGLGLVGLGLGGLGGLGLVEGALAIGRSLVLVGATLAWANERSFFRASHGEVFGGVRGVSGIFYL